MRRGFEVFGDDKLDKHLDEFSYYRLILFLCLPVPDFIQLTCFPIEDEQLLGRIRNSLESFAILKKILYELKNYNAFSVSSDLSKFPKVKISRDDLITAGIPSTWFIDSLPNGKKNTLQSQNFHCQSIR